MIRSLQLLIPGVGCIGLLFFDAYHSALWAWSFFIMMMTFVLSIVSENSTDDMNAELNRLRRGDLTSDEFQGLCHNLSPNCNAESFFAGCEAYQVLLFGKSHASELRKEIDTALAECDRLRRLCDKQQDKFEATAIECDRLRTALALSNK